MSGNSRRQPTRSVRQNARPANYYAKAAYLSRAQVEEPEQDEPHGFFPAITHFTDGVAALPREIMRHFTLLKETEGKAFPPDQAMNDIITRINKLPDPPNRPLQPHTQAVMGFSLNNSINGSAPSSIIDGSLPGTQIAESDAADQLSIAVDEHTKQRRQAFGELREAARHIMNILDEKNMVLNTANDTLTRQLARLEGTLPYVESELSEEARLGSNTHWALPHMKAARRGVPATSSRRDAQGANNLAAAAAAIHETDIAAVRSEARREAVRSQRRGNVDSDFDERPASKRAPAGAKAKRIQDAGIDGRNAPAGPGVKRRRIEKPAAIAMERSLSAAMNGRLGTLPAASNAGGQRKPKPLAANAAAAKKRYGVSESSPIVKLIVLQRNAPDSPSFPPSSIPGANKDQSPRPTVRARQNSALSTKGVPMKDRPPSTHSKGNYVGTPELKNVANITGRTVGEARSAVREAYVAADGGQAIEQEGVNGALVVDNQRNAMTWKRDETEPAHENGFRGPDTALRGGTAPSTAPNGIPPPAEAESAEAAPMSRSRSTRGANSKAAASSPALAPAVPAARSHHKNARQASKHSPPARDESSADEAEDSRQASEDPDGAPSTPGSDEPRYCICDQPSYGSMVACDNPTCLHEWFHLECVGLTEEPPENTKWYCNDCKKTLKRGRNGASNGR